MSPTPRTASRTSLALVLLFTWYLSGCGPFSPPRTIVPLNASVQPLQVIVTMDDGSTSARTFCTAFSINEKQHYWATARHCLIPETEEEADALKTISILGHPVHEVYRDPRTDVALLQGDEADAPRLPLSTRVPRVFSTAFATNDPIEIRGFPYGYGLIVTQGYLGAHYLLLHHDQFVGDIPCDILDVTGAPGNSGSPVLMNGQVVGLVWGGFEKSAHAISVPLEELTRALGPYWEP